MLNLSGLGSSSHRCITLPRFGSTGSSLATRNVRRHIAQSAKVQRRSLVKAAAAAQEVEAGKLISKTEIPAFIPREDLIHQLWGWARIECEESGAINYGLPMKVKPVYREEGGELWGFTTSIISRDGAVLTDIRVMFDEEKCLKHQWVGRGADGFPSLEGNTEEILGNELCIRKIDDNVIDDQTRTAIKGFCVKLMESINKYYAFGSAFVDDNT